MASGEYAVRRTWLGWLLLAGTGVVAAAGLALVLVSRSAVVPPPVTAPQAAAVSVAPSVPPVASGPSFDVVRVGPGGSAVIAGRAAPGAEVVLLDGTTELARTRADRRGEFVFTPGAALPPGARELMLASRDDPGSPLVRSEGSVMVVVPSPVTPAATSAPPAPVAVLLPGGGAPRLLDGRKTLSIDVVDYDGAGSIRFTGSAEPGSNLRAYVDNGPVGDTKADESGHWAVSPGDTLPAGDHRLRLDRLGGDGRVLARVELPFQRAPAAVPDLGGQRVVVQPGQNLWRLARAAYGSGVRYTTIYLANKDQIRDPGRIYPGQAFATPGGR